MNPGESLQRLVELGFDARDAHTRLALLHRVASFHARSTGQPPDWQWFVPGRVEIFGKHTDYAGGRSLLAALPRGFAVAATARADDAVMFRDAVGGHVGIVRAQDRDTSAANGLGYVAAAVRRLARNFPGASLGLDLTVGSDLPRAAGLSSSSALIVAAALALIRRAELEARPEWLAEIRTTYDLAAYLGALERGSDFGTLAGTHAVGTRGGSEDHTAILTCQAEFVSACRFVPMQPLGDARMPDEWRFVIASTGVVADKAGGAKERFNAASLATEALVELWNRHADRPASTLAEILAQEGAAARLQALSASSPHEAFAPETLRRRLAHFIAEDGRILDALAAFGNADAEALGALARESQADAERWLENQTPETSALARLALDHGALGSCSFGAGFGGSVWAVALASDIDEFAERWMGAYRDRFPGLASRSFVARPGPRAFQWSG